ncbi:MAG: ATP-binding cassette domain-containing protein [Proteobacteria bacterium]|nr:ATP-binding cassette domain-containing protein [Pseudomonadota bacterium]
MLEVNEVRFTYPRPQAHAHTHATPLEFRFDLRLGEGGCLVVLGPSGCGKSTLLNLIAGFLTPHSGDIRWGGQSLLGMPPHARPLSILFQSDNLFDHLDVWTNVALGVNPSLRLTKNDMAMVAEALAGLGIAGMETRTIPSLSGGQQQRVALARALVRSRLTTDTGIPRSLLLLDEPFSALDADTKAECLAEVRRLVDEFAITALLVTHDSEDARPLAADIFRLHPPAK